MAGFDNGTLSGLTSQVKQFGSILRGAGPPVPQAGVVGDLYIDTQTFFLYEKRADSVTDPWGHYLFLVPVAYQSTLKWFSAALPPDSIGVLGDYCLLWAGYANYGMQQPSICGPRAANGWPENGEGVDTQLDPTYAGVVWPLGVSDEGTQIAYSTSTQLIAVGEADEYILAIPISSVGGAPIGQTGVQSFPPKVPVTLNPLLTAQDSHGI